MTSLAVKGRLITGETQAHPAEVYGAQLSWDTSYAPPGANADDERDIVGLWFGEKRLRRLPQRRTERR